MNERLLRAKMVEHGYNDHTLSLALGINDSTFYRKKSGIGDFYRSEIKTIKDCLNLSGDEVDRIFFGDELAEMQEPSQKTVIPVQG